MIFTFQGKHTSNLKSHLALKHLEEYRIVNDINANSPATLRISGIASNIDNIKVMCMKLITTHGRPLAMMEDEAFQQLVKAASKDGIQVNIKSIKELVIIQAADIRNKICNEVKNSMISLKVDSVTCAERKFLGINIQYIKNSDIVIRNLAVTEVHQSQTGDHLKDTVEEVLTDFKINKDQIYSICTDNGANMIRMTKLLGGKYFIENEFDDDDSEEDEEMYETLENAQVFTLNNSGNFKIRGMLCAAHTLQLAIKDAITENVGTQAILHMARNVVNTLRQPNNAYRLKAAKLNKAINDCRTRWTSTYCMLERLLTFQEICNFIPEISLLVSDLFWENIHSIVKCLKPAYIATIALQKKKLTMGDFYIQWIECKNEIATIEHEFAQSLYSALERRELLLMKNDVVLEALYLDKRINLFLSQQQCDKAKSLLKETYSQINKIKITQNDDDNTDSPSNSPIVVSNISGLDAIEVLLQRAENARGPVRLINSFQANLNDVCGHRIPLKENIIQYWNNNSIIKPPEVAMVANVVLAAPATQVSVERLFSSLKFILNPLRTNLNQFFLRDLMLVRENSDLID